MNLESLKTKLLGKLNLADANAAVKEVRAALNDPSMGPTSTKAEETWREALAGNAPKFLTSNDAKAVLMLAAAEFNNLLAGKLPTAPKAVAPVPEPEAAVKLPAPAASSATPRTAASFQKNIPVSPAVVTPPSAAVAAPTPKESINPDQFASKPDFSALKGVERVTASMRWSTERDAYFLAEATKQIEAEEAADRPPSPFAGLPATAENLAKSLIYEQAEAAKPKVSPWSKAGSDRTKAIKERAAELKKSASL